MSKKYNYFYKITNMINNKYYLDVHKTDNINDNYMGSGTMLKLAISKYGIENFKKEILKYFNKYEDALIYESEIVTEKLINDINCYNLKTGGIGGFDNDIYGNVIDKKTNKCIRVLRDSDYYKNKENYNFVTENKITVIDESGQILMVDTKDERFINDELIFIIDSKNKIIVKDDNNNIYKVNITDEKYINGELKFIWSGKKHSDITINKMILAHKLNNNQKGEKNSQFGTCWITKENENKKIKKEHLSIWLQSGWIKGRNIKYAPSQNRSLYGEKNSAFGRIWIYNNELKENKRIKKYELDFWLEQKWVKGRMKFN